MLNELSAEREVIETALNFSYIVEVGNWQPQFLKYTLSAGTIDLTLDSSSFRYVIPKPADLVPLYSTTRVLEKASFNLVRVTMRNAVSQYYEKIRAFCLSDGTRQRKWEQAPWRPLARLVRNSFSHDFLIDFSDRSKTKPRGDVKFTFPSGRTIEIKNSMHGQPITGNNIPIYFVLELLEVMKDFVGKEL